MGEGGNPEMRHSVWDRIPLHVTRWFPQGAIRAQVYVSHGIAEHMGRYELLGQTLSENGILAEGHDHVGHGKSGGERVHVEDLSVYVKDIVSHVEDMKAQHPELPCFLMGHSMGGLLTVLVAAECQDLFDGIILSSAGLAVDPQSGGTLIKVAAKVLSWVVPRYGLKAVDSNFISTLPQEVEDYDTDPLVYRDPLKARWASEMLTYIEVAKEKLPAITKPVLIFHGTNDNLVPFSSSEFINKTIGSKDKKFEVFDGDFHEVLHDRNQERARELIKDWILSHSH